MELIFKQSIDLFNKDLLKKEIKEVRVDSSSSRRKTSLTQQTESFTKRLSFIAKGLQTLKGVSINLKRTYTREMKKLRYQIRFAKKPKNLKN